MLTPEQIQKLKTDDKLLVQGEFIKAHANGSILVSLSTKAWESSINELLFFHPYALSLPSEHGTSVPTPKHSPTRLFKKGDRVRIVKYNGRKFDAAPPTFQLGKVYSVDEDEDTTHCYVMLKSCDIYYAHPVAFLELVTPVEELEPYSVGVSSHTWYVYKDDDVVVAFNKKSHPNAKAAAEAECDRLNAEWRKEQNNG